MSDEFYRGSVDLEKELIAILKKVEKPQEILVKAAEEYAKDLRALPKPYSNLRRSKSKHMLETMTYRRAANEEVEVGAGVYWLRFVELGTSRTKKRKWATPANPFMRRAWESGKEKYQIIMLKEAGLL